MNNLIDKINKQLYNLEKYQPEPKSINESKIKVKVIKKTEKKNAFKPKNGYRVTVHYKGILRNGKVFDDSWVKNKPFTFTVGKGEVIKGWDNVIKEIKLGEKVRVVIPQHLAYGSKGIGNIIQPYSDLIFIIHLIKINNISCN